MWNILLFPFLWSLVSADHTSFHLYHYLNHSISPCSDFYSHVCSSSMHFNQTARFKSQHFYENLARKRGSKSRNNPIVNDIATAFMSKNCSFDSELYKSKLQKRCSDRFDCYLDEFNYFFDLYYYSTDEISDTLKFFAQHINNADISKIEEVTSNIVELLIEENDDDDTLDAVVDPYLKMLDRLYIMDGLGKADMKSRQGLTRLSKMVKNIRKVVTDRFTATPWLNETDRFGLNHLSQFLTTLDEITIMADFDEFDTDLSFWRKMDRFVTSKYFQYSKRSTGCKKFDVIHPFVTLKSKIESKVETDKDQQLYDRATYGLVYNGFNIVDMNAIVLLAPSFYPIMDGNSSETTLIAYAEFIAHEVFHSFIKNELIDSNEVFRNEANCLMNKFNSSCDIWADNTCNSGQQTFEEDAPDVEGLRIAYDLLKRTYTVEELKELEYKDLGITREQAFFYAIGVRACGDLGNEDSSDEHSSDKVRLNTAMSMLPEFTEAFGCQIGDEQYADQSSTCYLFGEQAGVDRGTHSSEEIGEIVMIMITRNL